MPHFCVQFVDTIVRISYIKNIGISEKNRRSESEDIFFKHKLGKACEKNKILMCFS